MLQGMSRLFDLSGKKYGLLTVPERAESRIMRLLGLENVSTVNI